MHTSWVHSYLMANVFGLYLLVMGMVLLMRKASIQAMVNRLDSDSPVIFFNASWTLMLGIFLVDVHHDWVLKPLVVVTVLCWMILFKALLWLVMPHKMLEVLQKIINGKAYYVMTVLMLMVGGLLLVRSAALVMHVMHLA